MKKNVLFLIMISVLSINKSISQKLTFITKYSKENSTLIQEDFEFSFDGKWLLKTSLYNNDKDIYPSSKKDGGDYDNFGTYYLVYNAKNYIQNNPLSKMCLNDTRIYKIAFDNKDGNIIYVLELGEKNGRKIEKYYITELGKQTFKI